MSQRFAQLARVCGVITISEEGMRRFVCVATIANIVGYDHLQGLIGVVYAAMRCQMIYAMY